MKKIGVLMKTMCILVLAGFFFAFAAEAGSPPAIEDNSGIPGLLEQLKSQIADQNTTIEDFEATITALEAQLADQNTTIEELEATIAVLEARLQYPYAAPIPQTGQIISYDNGDDGNVQAGIGFPDPRFTDNGDGTVTDNLTGLIWLKNAGCNFSWLGWQVSLSWVNQLENGQCGLTDDSLPGDWRMPNIRELLSLIDYGQSQSYPGYPFENVSGSSYWSSTGSSDYAWGVWFNNATVSKFNKSLSGGAWPVRGGLIRDEE
jgi:hypothetical protein